MMKGITPIISIIVLLLITVSLAGAAYVFLGSYMSGMTGQQLKATALPCVGGTSAYVTITNMGSQVVSLGTCDVTAVTGVSGVCGDITIVRTDGGNMDATVSADIINASDIGNLDSVTFIDTNCNTRCEYAFTRAGELQPETAVVDCR